MKKRFSCLGLCTLLLVLFYNAANAQCSVVIKSSSSGNLLKAYTSGDDVCTLTWQMNGIDVYTAYYSGFNIKGVTVAGGDRGGSGSGQLYGPADVSVDAAGNVYVLDAYNNRVQKWAPGSSTGITVAGGNGEGSAANQLFLPQGFWVTPDGVIYIADLYNHRIQKWLPGARTGVTVAGGHGYGAGADQLAFPRDVFVDRNGNIYIADGDNNRVQKWSPGSASGVTVAGGNGFGSGSNQLNAPFSVFVDDKGNIFVSDRANNRVQKWAPGAKSGSTVAGGTLGSDSTQLNNPRGLYVDHTGAVYVADYFNNRIQKWVPGATSGITVAGLLRGGRTAMQFYNPSGVYMSPSGDLYVTDEGNNRVQEFRAAAHINRDFIPQTAGSYRVIAGFEDGCTAVSADTVIGNSGVQSSSGIASAQGFRKIGQATVVYPNPAHRSTVVKFASTERQKYSICVSDMSGRLMLSANGTAEEGINTVELLVNNLIAGTYLLTVTKGGLEKESFKLLKE